MFEELVRKNRSYRIFDESRDISYDELTSLIKLARLTPSTANSQALKYILVNEKDTLNKVFPCIRWAAALNDFDGPQPGQRPTGYIIILCDKSISQNKPIDDGIVSQTIMLGAVSMGLGGCMIGNIDRTQLADSLNIDTKKYNIDLILALGKPAEEIIIEDYNGTDINYYRDSNNVHHVPKRSIDELIIS